MKILDARKAQKYLYLHSDATFKQTKTIMFEGKLLYVVYHLVHKENVMCLEDDFIKTLSDRKFDGLTSYITYLKKGNIPIGMYLAETIDID